MLEIPEYQILTKIHESSNSRVYRGIRKCDRLPVILKILQKDYPSIEEITRYQQEYEITHSLSFSGVIQAYGLQQYQRTFVIILEDFGGESLAKLIATIRFSLIEVLKLAIQITESISEIHNANIIHKDINPSNIVLNRETQQLKIIDFGISTTRSHEILTLKNPTVLEGTLAYISPEQTGRMNRSLDYRTDFYSLGVTLYQLLTHWLPFESNDDLELIHYHLALEPVPPHVIDPEIPVIVSQIVLKLLAKTAEERYQSGWGIKTDLEKCLIQLQNTGGIEPFALARQDIFDKFRISEKLYGREKEVETLLAAIARLKDQDSSSSQVELMLIAGYSGIGKSVLVREIYQPITQQRGYFISGKFEQYQHNIPYFAIAQAFRTLIKQLLTEDEVQLCRWRENLLAALASNSRVISQVIPALELIVGNQPDVLQLPPTQAQNRFNQVFQNFIRVFTRPEHPLIIFLDDLQWADHASLKLIQLLATATEGQSLLLIGAYRDNEVNATHPLTQVVEEIRQSGGVVNQVFLSPLSLADINQLIADTLHCQPEDSLPLAVLVQLKTGGNPFFMNEFLKSLYTEGLLEFNRQTQKWQWSIEQIQEREITDNIVELMTGKIQKLNEQTQQVLQLSACIGNSFCLETLAFAAELSQPETAQALEVAIAQGLILPISNVHKLIVLNVPLPSNLAIEYKFVHDRIQQAAYSLIPETQLRNVHLQIGKKLLQQASIQQLEQNIFDITNQLNLGKELIKIDSQRDELAQLNLMAGERAKASTAYKSTFTYFQTGLDLLTDNCWQTQYDLALALYSLVAEAAYLNGRLDQMKHFVNRVLENARTLEDKSKVYEVRIQAYAGQMQFLEALEFGLQALAELGVHLPVAPTSEDIKRSFANTALKLQGRRVEDLLYLPPMTDAIASLSIRLMANLIAPAYQAAPPLFPLIILEMVNLSIQYGNHDLSAFVFASYSNILGSVLLEIETAYQFVQLALKLLDQSGNLLIRCKTLFMANVSVLFRNIHLKETIKPLQDAYQIGIETGDLEFAGYSILHYCDHCFFTDTPLSELKSKLERSIKLFTKLKQSTNANALRVYRQTVLNLMTTSFAPHILIGEAYDESQELPLLQQANNHKGLFYLYFNKLFLSYYFQNFPQAVDNANRAENYPDGGRSNAVFPIFYFYDSLARLMLYPQVNQVEQIAILKRVASSQEKMQLWAHHAPMNYLHKWHLVEAERYRVLGEVVAAMDTYDRAIALAREHEYLQEEALANELAAKFYLANNRITIAKAYLQEARYGYLRWGATAKVQDLERQYSELLEVRSQRIGTRKLNTTQSSGTKLEALDLETVLKASQAISATSYANPSEILLDKLLAKLMTILIESAGAQMGYLILPTQDEWRIEAMGSIGETVAVLQSIPLELISADSNPDLPTALINYVVRTQESIVLDNAAYEGNFQSEPWIVQRQSKSILCATLLNQGKLTGIILLENNLTTSAFTPERIEILRLLSSQAAISIDNAHLLKQQAELNQSLQAEIAERQQAEKDRNRLITILEASTDYISMADPQGNVLWHNSQTNKLTEIPLDQDSDFRVSNFHPQWALDLIQNQGIPTAIRDGTWVGETALLDRNGREIPVSQLIIAHKASDGSLEYVSSVTRDISAVKASEAEVRQLNAELEKRVIQRTEQLEAVNKSLEAFSYSVSHDLRAPLRAIAGFSRVIQENYGNQLDAQANRYLKLVRENAKRMGELIDDLLNLSRLDRQEIFRQSVIVNELIQMVLSDLAPDLQGRQIEFAIANLPECQADVSLLKQVWINLLGNAIKYTRYKSLAYIEVGYEIINGEGVYLIKDNGAGFDMRYADKLFGAFQRLHCKQEFTGTGIGLAIAQRIIQRHGGRIWAKAAIDQGATFYFTIPSDPLSVSKPIREMLE